MTAPARPYPATLRQHAVLRFIAGFIAAHGFAPSRSEIARDVGLVTKGEAQRLVEALVERGTGAAFAAANARSNRWPPLPSPARPTARLCTSSPSETDHGREH